MKLLLDTHVLLWALTTPNRLPARIQKMLRSGKQSVWFSAASVWEIEIKRATGKLRCPDDLLEMAADATLMELPIVAVHAHELRQLPMLHTDPFDRLLIAQARVEGLTLVTADEKILAYPVSTIQV